MMTLSDLNSAKCINKTRIDMACGLTEFPQAILNHADSLEILNLSNNRLSTLPDEFSQLHQLRILFLSENNFQIFPSILAACPQLNMVGFKSNQIMQIPEHALPKNIRWLILTDNQIEELPSNIGQHQQLQKLMLAGNKLRSLPKSMASCKKLELLRISANQLDSLPLWLFDLPKLSWFAFAGNPCSTMPQNNQQNLPQVPWHTLTIKQQLGEGASGSITKASWKGGSDIAVKVFKGAVTSDGFPADEMQAAIKAGKHDHLIEIIGQLIEHPEQREGLLLTLISESYQNLANPPSLTSCTRDNYPNHTRFYPNDVLRIALAIAAAAKHLHQNNINHGDLYAHNILINDTSHCFLGDFGAASLYQTTSDTCHDAIERLEVRAFGCLLEELFMRVPSEHTNHPALPALEQLRDNCLQENTCQRPSFSQIHKTISLLQNSDKAQT